MVSIITKRIAAFAAFIFVSAAAHAASDFDQPAIGGYDLVSYHQESGPVRGSGFHVAQHHGATFLFASEENKNAFEADPEKYLPAYNGYCAFGASLGKKFHSDPTIYKIVDDVLYLNLDAGIQEKWNADIAGNIEKADKNWKTIATKSAADL